MTDVSPYSQGKSNKRRKKRRVVEVWNENELVSVDEADYEVFEFLRTASEKRPKGVHPYDIPTYLLRDCSIEYSTAGKEKRICSLNISSRNFSLGLLEKVSCLSALKAFHAEASSLDSLPPSIGSWQNLEVLDLTANYLLYLPKEIGNLVNLRELKLSGNKISWLPSSIGNLQKLYHLDISGTDIVELPEEFWNLTSLECLKADAIGLPSSIDRLQNLEFLTLNIKREFPNELCNLSNLTYLELALLNDVSLPTELGNLTTLESLTITTRWGEPNSDIEFPSSLANLQNLNMVYLDLQNVERELNLQQLNFLMKLPKLKALLADFDSDQVTEDLYDFLKDLIHATPSLVTVGYSLEDGRPDIAYALSRNRFKQNNPFVGGSKASSHVVNKLWPKMLSNAKWAFENDEWESPQLTDTHDAVYRLLVEGRDSFHQTLLNRSNFSRSQEGRNIVRLQMGDREVKIDENDYRLYENLRSKARVRTKKSRIKANVEGNAKRICHLRIYNESFRHPPNEILGLSALKRLDIEWSDFDEYAFNSIGLLQNLEVLHIADSFLEDLPHDIGTLVNLKTLNLRENKLETLPSSIGNLKNLEELDVTNNCLLDLPHEIGGLKNLKKLELYGNRGLRSLPRSIGNLRALKYLGFEETAIIDAFPDEIWELSGLRTLIGTYSTRITVPPSIGQLRSLEYLKLGFKGNLPEEFGNLINLEILYLKAHGPSSRVMLPQSMAKLRNLTDLELYMEGDEGYFDLRQLDFIRGLPKLEHLVLKADPKKMPRDASEYMVDLIQATPSLIYMDSFMQNSMPEVSFAILCNCFKSRTPFRCSKNDTPLIVNKLWPLMLSNASRAFELTSDYCESDRERYSINPHDAVYKILKDGRGSFLRVLLDRSRNSSGGEGGESN